MSLFLKSPLGRSVLMGALFLSLGACVGAGAGPGGGMGTVADILIGGGVHGGRELRGEVRRIDTRREEIQIASSWGRTERVRYNRGTRVLYRDRRLNVRDLARGDVVRVRVDSRRRGELYANRIVLQERSRNRNDNRRGNRGRGWFSQNESVDASIFSSSESQILPHAGALASTR